MSEPPRSTTGEGEQAESAWGLLKRLGATVWAAVFTVTVPAAGGLLLYRFGGPIAEFWRGLGTWGVVAYAAAFSVPLGAALLPTWVQALLAGFVFAGAGEAAGAAMGAIVIGAAIGYGLARVVSGDRARAVVREHAKWEAVEEALLESGFWRALLVIALVRLPSTPFALTNLVMAALRAPVAPFLIGTLAGALPRTVLWVMVGRRLGAFSGEAVAGAKPPVWGIAVSVVGLLAALFVLGQISKRAIERVAGRAGEQKGGGAEEQR
jgi:uncharacterized membrane protein YdjX (TVP38/TMEM64 family)